MNENYNIYAVYMSIVIFLKLTGPLIIRIGIDATILGAFHSANKCLHKTCQEALFQGVSCISCVRKQ